MHEEAFGCCSRPACKGETGCVSAIFMSPAAQTPAQSGDVSWSLEEAEKRCMYFHALPDVVYLHVQYVGSAGDNSE
jgi:hypothetical protein